MSHCAHEAGHGDTAITAAARADHERERRGRESARPSVAVPYAIEPCDESERRTRIERLKGLLAIAIGTRCRRDRRVTVHGPVRTSGLHVSAPAAAVDACGSGRSPRA